MAPKRAASGSSRSAAAKRKNVHSDSPDLDTDPDLKSDPSEIDEDGKHRVTKKAKVEKPKAEKKAAKKPAGADKKGKAKQEVSESAEGALAPNGQPTNKVIPMDVAFPARTPGTVRIATWNICGLAAAQKKGFKYYVEAEDPDVLVLTETKVNNEPVDPALTSRFPHRYWAISAKKTYSGTAILSKIKPLSVSTTLPGHPDPESVKGRILTLEFEKCFLIGTYVVNAGQELKTLEAKKEWNAHFTAYIRDLDRRKPVIWTGDLNVAPTEKDLANAKKNWNKTAGYTEAETSAFARILDPAAAASGSDSEDGADDKENDPPPGQFVDIWRKMHPEDRHYTYFSYRFNCRMKGLGWRLDMFVLSKRLEDRAKMCEIRSDIYGASDHCPVVLEIEGEL